VPAVIIGKGIIKLDDRMPEWHISSHTSDKLWEITKAVGLALIMIAVILLAINQVWIIFQILGAVGAFIGVGWMMNRVITSFYKRYRITHPKKQKPRKEKPYKKPRETPLIVTKIECWYERKCPIVEVVD
jgi:hypothetical protein